MLMVFTSDNVFMLYLVNKNNRDGNGNGDNVSSTYTLSIKVTKMSVVLTFDNVCMLQPRDKS